MMGTFNSEKKTGSHFLEGTFTLSQCSRSIRSLFPVASLETKNRRFLRLTSPLNIHTQETYACKCDLWRLRAPPCLSGKHLLIFHDSSNDTSGRPQAPSGSCDTGALCICPGTLCKTLKYHQSLSLRSSVHLSEFSFIKFLKATLDSAAQRQAGFGAVEASSYQGDKCVRTYSCG